MHKLWTTVLNDDDLCWSMLTLLGRGDLVFIQQHFVGEHAAHARQGAHALQRSDVALRAAASPINLHTCMYACACVITTHTPFLRGQTRNFASCNARNAHVYRACTTKKRCSLGPRSSQTVHDASYIEMRKYAKCSKCTCISRAYYKKRCSLRPRSLQTVHDASYIEHQRSTQVQCQKQH